VTRANYRRSSPKKQAQNDRVSAAHLHLARLENVTPLAVCRCRHAPPLWHNLAAVFILINPGGIPMNDRERFLNTMKYQAVDRAPLYEFMWPTWPETAERWAKEGGYVQGQTDFGCDKWLVEYSWFWPQPPFARDILEEDDKHVTFVDPQGIVMREFKNNPLSSMPQFIRYPVETREDFRKYWRERMQPDLTQRIGPDWRPRLRALRVIATFPFVIIADRWGGFFGPLRNLVGVETPLHALL
jgi:hypothetical protein